MEIKARNLVFELVRVKISEGSLFFKRGRNLKNINATNEESRARPCVHVDDPTRVHVNEVEYFVGHGVEPRPWLDIVIVMVCDEDARGVHGKRPEPVEVHFLTHLQGGGHEHQAAAEPLGAHTLHRPEALHVEQVLRVKEEHAPLGVEVVQHVLDAERHIRVAGVVEGRKNDGGVVIVLEDVVERPPPFLQFLKPAAWVEVKPAPAQTQSRR